MSFQVPQTPQRPTPGAFIATPAANRPPFFRSASSQQPPVPAPKQPTAPTLPPTSPTLTPIERASRTINETLARDARYPELESYVGQGATGDYEIPTNPAWTPFQKVKTYEIPDRIFEQCNHTQMTTSMGLFAEINHAWVAIDNQLYLWDYTHPNPELVGYEEQPNAIVAVKLVKPRAKVFVDAVTHLLVVATTTEIHLIGVACKKGPEGVNSVDLYKTGMSVSIKGIRVGCIEGSAKTGRIFFGDGRDTDDVYEITYQQGDGWFSSKCNRVNHVRKAISLPALSFRASAPQEHIVQIAIDDTRNLLYTLSSSSAIRVFHMKTISSLDLVITRPLATIKTMCGHMVRQTDLLYGRNVEIIGINPIAASEAGQLSLMATTSTGCRIFLSTTSGSFYTDSNAAPTSMQVRHIRFPPPDAQSAGQPSSNQLQPYQTSMAPTTDSKVLIKTVDGRRYAPGSFFCFVEKPGEPNHLLFASAPDAGKIARPLEPSQGSRYIENAQFMALGGVLQDIGLCTAPFSAASGPVGFGNELAVQFDKPVDEIAILTHTGIETLRRRRLVDTFASVIKYGGGEEGIEAEMRKFVRYYGRPEIAATALAVACGQGADVGPDSRVAKITDTEVTEVARRAFLDHGGKAQLNENSTLDGSAVDNVRPSPRHDGIALYISRLVRSIWRSAIIKETKTPIGGPKLECSIGKGKLQDIQRALIDLQEFLELNKPRIDGLAGPEALGRVTSKQDEVELQGENRALTSLVQLINSITEGISFTLLLFEERMDEILLLLPEDTRSRVRSLTFEGLFAQTEGKELAKDLVKALVNRSIAKGSNVESVADSLRRRCGSFCSPDDVIIFKAQESLKKAADTGANTQKGRTFLNDSLRLFEQVAKSLSMENLTSALDQYISMEFYAGAIKLALKMAQELDRGNRALSWIKDGKPAQDIREAAYQARNKCYDLVHKVIVAVDKSCSDKPAVVDGTISPSAKRRQEAYDVINNSMDEVFQNHLYDWYLSQGWSDRLLEITSEYVVSYLNRMSLEDVAHADLLWRYYAHYHNYLDAADVQYKLAKSGFELSLERRIEYLSRAKANASTRVPGFSELGGVRSRQSRQELLRNITDLLDVANIQDDILQKMKSDIRLTGDRRKEVLAKLDGNILSLDELYHDYADQAAYYAICLLIYHAADYRNLPDIRNTWSNLFEQTHNIGVEDGHLAPWELVAEETRQIGRRVNRSETVFPVNVLLQMLLQYDVEYYTHGNESSSRGLGLGRTNSRDQNVPQLRPAPLTWVLDVFISLDVPFEILVATLESIWYAQEMPFAGKNRKLVVKWLIYTVERWEDISRRQGLAFGGEENAIGLSDCLSNVLGGTDLDGREDAEWRERGKVIRAKVEADLR